MFHYLYSLLLYATWAISVSYENNDRLRRGYDFYLYKPSTWNIIKIASTYNSLINVFPMKVTSEYRGTFSFYFYEKRTYVDSFLFNIILGKYRSLTVIIYLILHKNSLFWYIQSVKNILKKYFYKLFGCVPHTKAKTKVYMNIYVRKYIYLIYYIWRLQRTLLNEQSDTFAAKVGWLGNTSVWKFNLHPRVHYHLRLRIINHMYPLTIWISSHFPKEYFSDNSLLSRLNVEDGLATNIHEWQM